VGRTSPLSDVKKRDPKGIVGNSGHWSKKKFLFWTANRRPRKTKFERNLSDKEKLVKNKNSLLQHWKGAKEKGTVEGLRPRSGGCCLRGKRIFHTKGFPKRRTATKRTRRPKTNASPRKGARRTAVGDVLKIRVKRTYHETLLGSRSKELG